MVSVRIIDTSQVSFVFHINKKLFSDDIQVGDVIKVKSAVSAKS